MDPDDNVHSQMFVRWQQLYMQEKQATSTKQTETLADVMRNQLAVIEYGRASKLLTMEGANHLLKKKLEAYAAIIDAPEEKGGLNNYADSVLALASRGCNDSQCWKSSFTPEMLDDLPCLKKLSDSSKIAQRCIIPEGKENSVVLSKDRPKDGGFDQLTSKYNVQQQPLKTTDYTTKPTMNTSTLTLGSNSVVGASKGVWPQQRPGYLLSSANDTPFLHCAEKRAGVLPASNFSRAFAADSSRFGVDQSEAATCQNYSTSASFHPNKPASSSSTQLEQPDMSETTNSAFRTARQQLAINDQKKFGRSRPGGNPQVHLSPSSYGSNKKSLGARRGPGSKFVPPLLNRNSDEDDGCTLVRQGSGQNKACVPSEDEPVDPRLKNFEPRMLELIMSEIMDRGPPVTWDDIAGLEFVKKTIKEIVIWPMLRPDIFTGLRGPPKGLLLFGPPGTGKTLIGKCIASQSKSTFFSISASSLTSKWVGEGEKMVRALFAVARVHQPAVVFIDEIDSLLSQRSDSEHESSRRIKTEFLVQLDGATTGDDDRILVVGATNRPQEIDEAARRRFVKRLYVPLPEREARKQIILLLMSRQSHSLDESAFEAICDRTDGYSGADMANLCREAALGPIRCLAFNDIENITADEVRPINFQDFTDALRQVRASVSDRDLDNYIDWNKQYGSWGI